MNSKDSDSEKEPDEKKADREIPDDFLDEQIIYEEKRPTAPYWP